MGHFREFTEKHGRESALQALAEILQLDLNEIYPVDMGFALLVWPDDNNPDSVADYISSGVREDMIQFLRETADRLEKNRTYHAPRGMLNGYRIQFRRRIETD